MKPYWRILGSWGTAAVIASLAACGTSSESPTGDAVPAEAGPAATAMTGDAAPPPTPKGDSGVAITDAGGVSALSASDRFPGSKVFLPATAPAPALVLLHGSEGGLEGTIAEYGQRLAKKGFVVLSFCWFGCKDTPSIIQNVPLDRTVEAATLLKSSTEVAGQKVGLFGWSRGGEQAVLVSSLLQKTDLFSAVAVHAPSDTIVCAYDPNSFDDIFDTDPSTGQQVFAAAWTWHQQKLFGEKHEPWGSGPRIEVEKYPGPMWVSHGTADQTWPVTRSQHIVAARNAVPGLETETHYWQGEDHVVSFYSQADQTAWMSTLVAFFQKHLAP